MKSDSGSRFGLGLVAGASTGIFWGVPFLAPQVLPGYTPFEIAFGRFFFFGLMGMVFVKRSLGILRELQTRERFRVFLLSASGFWLYSSVLFWSIRQTDGILSSLVLGMLPVTIPLFTPGRKRAGGVFYFGLVLITVGLVLLLARGEGGGESGVGRISGVFGLFLSLAMWTWFSIANSQFLTERNWISRRDFSSLMGLISLVSIGLIYAPTFIATPWIGRESVGLYFGFSAILGVGSSWFANWLWNVASVRLPSEVSGTLLVFETLFGVVYTLMYQGRFPDLREVLAILMCLSGVVLAITAQIKGNDRKP